MLFLFPLFAVSYPEWFLYQGRFPGTVVGYSGYGSTQTDAEINYCVFKDCIVKGNIRSLAGYEQRENNYFYHYSADSLRAISGKLIAHSRFVTQILASNEASIYSLESKFPEWHWISEDSLSKPLWLDAHFFEDDNFYYSVGQFFSGRNRNDAWKSAEERAMFNLANQLGLEFFTVKILQNNELEQAFGKKIFHRFRDIQILERYPDKINSQYFVLIRIQKENIQSPFLKNNFPPNTQFHNKYR